MSQATVVDYCGLVWNLLALYGLVTLVRWLAAAANDTR